MVRFATALTGCVDSSWFFVISGFCIVVTAFLGLLLLLVLEFLFQVLFLPALFLVPSVCSFSTENLKQVLAIRIR